MGDTSAAACLATDFFHVLPSGPPREELEGNGGTGLSRESLRGKASFPDPGQGQSPILVFPASEDLISGTLCSLAKYKTHILCAAQPWPWRASEIHTRVPPRGWYVECPSFSIFLVSPSPDLSIRWQGEMYP